MTLFYATTIIKNAKENLKRLLKMASRNASSTLRLLTEVYPYKRGQFWRKCSWNDSTVICFSEKKWAREYFEATT